MKKRLLDFLAHLGMGQNAFEKTVGMSTGSISGMTKGMRADNLAKIAKIYPELNLRWLLLGEGNMLIEKSQESAESTNDQIKELNETIALLRDVIKDMRAQITELRSK